MNRLLLYVHFNKYGQISEHVNYQLEKLRPLFSKIVLISNSPLSIDSQKELSERGLMDDFLQRENEGFDFAAWRDGMDALGFDQLANYDSVTLMNDTCFGPLWDLETIYQRFEENLSVDFWGMTNHASVNTKDIKIPEHLQSYFISFKKSIVSSKVFKNFWNHVQNFDDVQQVINNYEIKFTETFIKEGFKYSAVLDTVPIHDKFFHRNFTIHYPNILINNKVPFIKIKTFDLSSHLSPYLLKAIETNSDYPSSLIIDHMTDISVPTPAYLLDRKVISDNNFLYSNTKKIAIHLHTYYVDLLPYFLKKFSQFSFDYDLFLTTDSAKKQKEIQDILNCFDSKGDIYITGNKGRDIIPMLKLKNILSNYDFIGHFHTKKSPEYPEWVGDSWREELCEMLLDSADSILSTLESKHNLGLVIADIPSFFRYTRIVEPWNEKKFADGMNELWTRMNLNRKLDFNKMNTFIMSYGTFIWFKYEALKPLFELELEEGEIPLEPLKQHTILHSIERILVYLAWAQRFDYAISKNPVYITPMVDNTVLNIRPDLMPNTYVDFNNIGGIKGALKYIVLGPASAVKYIVKRLLEKVHL